MIRIGLNENEKQKVVSDYVRANGIKAIYIFAPLQFKLSLPDIDAEYFDRSDIIMYVTFYDLLERIDDSALLVFNECLRVQNRSDLTYNCAHHYCNQTSHIIVFEHFPFIENKEDFMILLDLINKGKYKGKGFSYEFLTEEDILVKPYSLELLVIQIATDLFCNSDIQKEYEREKQKLFDNLGMSDPDTIPRKLHNFVGKYKKTTIRPDLKYVARNKRYKMSNVETYKNFGAQEYIILDFPHRRLDFNDFLKITGMTRVQFINSGTKVDDYYAAELRAWLNRLECFYAKARIYE